MILIKNYTKRENRRGRESYLQTYSLISGIKKEKKKKRKRCCCFPPPGPEAGDQ
jgi:hypothetical protein